MSKAGSKGRIKVGRLAVLLVAVGIIGVIAAGPALAAGDTTGSGAGAGQFTSHTVPGQLGETPLCLVEHQQRFELTNSGDYTAVDEATGAVATYSGVTQMTVTGNDQTYFGPTGTHGDDPTCSPDSLGESGAVNVRGVVSGQTTVNGVITSVSCSGNGIYFRIANHVHIQFDGTCTVRTGALTVTNADAFHVVEGEQVPTSFATAMVEDPDLQQVIEQDVVGASYVVTPEEQA